MKKTRTFRLIVGLLACAAVFFFAYAASTRAFTGPSATPPNNGAIIPINMGGTGATTTAQALANLGAAASGANSDITSLTPLTGNPLQIGNAGFTIGSSLFGTDQGGNIELGGNNSVANPVSGGIPYIDFHYGTGTAQDYNVRIINNANNSLGIYANGSLTLNVGSTSTDSMIVGGGLGTLKVGTLTFSDGTSQTTAATGIPSGLDILSASQTAPSGYTYTGNYVVGNQVGSWASAASIPQLSTYQIWDAYGAMANGIYYYFVENMYSYTISGKLYHAYYYSIQSFNPVTNSWSTIYGGSTAPSGFASWNMEAWGSVVYVPERATSYNTITNTWSSIAANPYNTGGQTNDTIAVDNGVIYLISGNFTTNCVSTCWSGVVFAYNTSNNSWSEPAALPNAVALASASTVNGIIYVIGGEVGQAQTYVQAYNPSTNSWTQESAMPHARYSLTTQAANGMIYAIGGSSTGESCSGYCAMSTTYQTTYYVEAYNPATNLWSEQTPINFSYSGGSFQSFAYGNEVFVIPQGALNMYSFTTPVPYYVMSKN